MKKTATSDTSLDPSIFVRSEDPDIIIIEKVHASDIKEEVEEEIVVDLCKEIKKEAEDIADEYVQPLECLELTMDEKDTGTQGMNNATALTNGHNLQR